MEKNNFCKMVTVRLEKKPNTKTVYQRTQDPEIMDISRDYYQNMVGEETIRFFRRLGGSESITRNYTKAGYLITKVISTSPDKNCKIIREFMFY